jgi:hypothetical protein
MDKRLLLAIALSVGIMLLWNTVLFPPRTSRPRKTRSGPVAGGEGAGSLFSRAGGTRAGPG